MTAPVSFVSLLSHPGVVMGRTDRSDQIRHVDFQQGNIPKDEEETQQCDQIGRNPHGKQLNKAIPLSHVRSCAFAVGIAGIVRSA
jgi:hypothetical protein